jgi:hypothetical protein
MHRIPADTNASAEGVLWFFSVIWFGLLGFMSYLAGADAGIVCGIVPGLLPLGIAIRTMQTRLRYGDAEFEMTGPAAVGGRLEGTLHLPRAAGEEDRVRAELKCRYRRSSKARPVLWRGQAFAGPSEPREPGRGRFAISIDIPATCVPSGREGAYWTLNVAAEHGLPALDVLFNVFVEGRPEAG